MKKILALFLAMSMFFALAACGNNNANDPDSSPSLGAEQESQAALESKENIDNTYIRPAVSVAWKSVTSLTPWSTANDIGIFLKLSRVSLSQFFHDRTSI